MQKQTIRAFVLMFVVVFSTATHAQQAITGAYSLTKTGFGSANRITDAGTIYVIRVDGLIARAIANHVTPTNVVTDGKLAAPAKGFIHSFGVSGDAQQIKPGDRYYVHEIETKDDAVVFTLLSLDTVSAVDQGHSVQSRLRFYLKFDLPKDTAKSLSAEAVHTLTDPFFLPEGTPALTPTVQLGQSLDEVKKSLGDPTRVIDLGPKKILVYKDIKVTLVDGKVTDAQ